MGKLSVSVNTGKRARAVKVVLGVALVSLLVVTVYEVENYGHEVKWKFTLGPTPYSGEYYSCQTVNGSVYVYHSLGSEQGVYVLDQDGNARWSLTNIESAPMVGSDGTLYAGATLSGDNHPSFCAFASNGSLVWSYPVANGSFSNTLIGPEGNVYTSNTPWDGSKSYESMLLAFSPSGQFLWTIQTQIGQPFAVLSDGTLLMQMHPDTITGVSTNGTAVWMVTISPISNITPSHILYGAVVGGDTAYAVENFANLDGDRADLFAVGLNGSVLWTYPGTISNGTQMGCICNPLVDTNGDILFVRYNGTGPERYTSLISVDSEGRLRWEYRDTFIGIPTIKNNMIYVGTSSGLTALDLDGHVKWRADTRFNTAEFDQPAPAVGEDGTVYSSVNDGIVAVGTNPIVLVIGLIVLVPIIAVCLMLLWSLRKEQS